MINISVNTIHKPVHNLLKAKKLYHQVFYLNIFQVLLMLIRNITMDRCQSIYLYTEMVWVMRPD